MSSGSESFESEDMTPPHVSHQHRGPIKNLSSKVEHLAVTLQDTNKNLRDVDQMLLDYRHQGDHQSGTINKLKRDLIKTKEKLDDEKYRQSLRESGRSLRSSDLEDTKGRRSWKKATSPLRDYDKSSSDRELADRKSKISVRFFDDMDTNSHDLHQSLRDLASGQIRLEDDIHREIGHRQRYESNTKAFFTELKNSFKIPEAMQNVDKRLQDIQDELRSERLNLHKRQEDSGHLSAELKSALSEQSGVSVANGTSEVKNQHTDTHKLQLERELDTVRRQLDVAEGGRDALSEQMEELRHQLSRADQERYRLSSLLDQQEGEMQQRKQQAALERQERESWLSDKRHLEEEMQTMRSQLTKSAVVMGEYSDLRHNLQQSEKQRTQLSDHIQVLKKEIDTKEHEQLKLIKRLQETSEKLQETEKGRHQALLQLEDALQRLRDLTRDAEKIVEEKRGKQKMLEESEHQRELIKTRAQDTITQWKVKCKKLEREVDRQQHTAQQATERSEQLIKQLESLRNQTHTDLQHMEHFKRELAHLLAFRAQQDEQVRVKDVENNELKALKMDLERDLRDCKLVIDRLEQELRSANDKNMQLYDEKAKFEDQLGASQTAQLLLQNQVQQMQKELKEVSMEKVELAAQTAEIAKERNELRSTLQESRKGETAVKEELAALVKRLQEEKDFHNNRVEVMKAELQQYKAREAHIVQEMTRRYNKENAECQAQLHAIKIELQEEKSSNKLLKKHNEKLKHEAEKLHKQLVRTQEDAEKMQGKYFKIREEYITKAQLTEDGISRAKDIELELVDSKERFRRMEKDFQNILYSLHGEVNSLIEIVSFDAFEAYKAIASSSVTPEDLSKWLAEVKSKLDWVKNEFRERRHKAKQTRREYNIAETYLSNNLYSSENNLPKKPVERDIDDEISNQNNELQMRPLIVSITNSEVHHGDEELEEALKRSLWLEEEKHGLEQQVSSLKDSQRERDKIHERYAKLQETISVLKQELLDANTPKFTSQTNATPAKKKEKRVRIAPVVESSFEENESSIERTPSPLKLSDQEFASRFIPKTP